jgi:chromosome segregation ATPase
MEKENRNFYVMVIVLVVLVGYIAYSLKDDGKASFREVMKSANDKLDSINREVVKSRQIIADTYVRLDAIQKDMGQIKARQGNSNANVDANDQQLKEKLKEKEKELLLLKGRYGKIKNERDLISQKLDSLADVIGVIEP